MKKISNFRHVSLGILFLVIAVLMLSLTRPAASPAKSPNNLKSDLYLIGVMDPDGRKHTWALPAETASGIGRRLAAKYPRNSIDGVTFFKIGSWRDTANLAIEAHAQQGALIMDLFYRVERLKKNGGDKKLTSRVTRIEKQLNKMTDSGNP